MLPEHFLHPDHVIPTVKFVAALVETAYQLIAHVLVEIHAVVGDVGIRGVGDGDAGVSVKDILAP
jgi:hypothetical protein